MKRTTIFRQLITNIITPVLISLLIVTFINYRQIRLNQERYNSIKSKMITNEIQHIIELQDHSLEILEAALEERMRSLSDIIVSKYMESNNIEELNLFAIRQELGMNPEKEDIYLISKEGIVVKSTFLQDIELNMFVYGEEKKKLIEGVFKGGNFVCERFSIEGRTQKYKKYTYQPTKNNNYIVELGSYSDEADQIMDNIKNIFDSMKGTEEGIVSIDMFINPNDPFALNRQAGSNEKQLSFVRGVFQEKENKIVEEKEEGKHLKYEYIYMNRNKSGIYKDVVIQIIHDNSFERSYLEQELFKLLLLFIATIALVALIIYNRAKRITGPIEQLLQYVQYIAKGNFSERVKVTGNNEIALLTDKFNEMIRKIDESYHYLEQKVNERTKEVTQKNELLSQKNRLLSDINQNQKIINQKLKNSEVNLKEVINTKDKFFSIISHDLKSPLNSLISLSELLTKGLKEDMAKEEILDITRYIHESSKNLFNLLENLLQWASSHTGKLKFVPEEFDLKEIIDETIALLGVNADSKNLEVSSQVVTNTIVYADKDMIKTIFRNLLNNSIKFSNEKGVIEISSVINKNYVETSVSDQGIGITEANLKKLFLRDSLFTTPGTKNEQGTGLGLILTKEFVEKNGGNIWVDSEQGKGARFTFQIPREKEFSPYWEVRLTDEII